MKTVTILGSTGSIGRNTLKVISQLKEKFKVVGLACASNADLLAEQINRFSPEIAAIMDESKYISLQKKVNGSTELISGQAGIEAIAAQGADIIVIAIGGSAALLPTLKAMEHSKRVALANKESLVMAGDIIIQKARQRAVEIIPIDSEHSAIFQCLKSEDKRSLEKIYLTCSGGPLIDLTAEELEFVEPDFALRHPCWEMGKKISIDSATLMNKGLEVIEAHYLFGLPADKIDILIHPQSVVHSLVQFVDGSVLAQLSQADMCIPIQYALTYPAREPLKLSRLNFSEIESLTFHLPDLVKFPCLGLAFQVAREKGLQGAALNACDEECVLAYLEGKIKITEIARIIELVLAKLDNKDHPSLEEILAADRWAREQTIIQLGKRVGITSN